MEDNFNGLTPAETERLALLVEECAEVQQIAMKILRHGFESSNPEVERASSNRDHLAEELGHLRLAVQLLKIAGDVSIDDMEKSYRRKDRLIGRWLHHQPRVER